MRKPRGGQVIPLENKPRNKCRHWKLRVSTGLNPRTGKYACRNKNVRGTYTEACEALIEFRGQVLHEHHRSNAPVPTFEQLADEFIQHKLDLRIITEMTASNQQKSMSLWVRHLGKVPVNKIEPHMIMDAIKASMAGDTPSGRPAKATYINLLLNRASNMYEYAIEQGYASSDPFSEIDKLKSDAKKRRALDDEEVKSLLEKLTVYDAHHVAVLIALLTGLRLGEIVALLWQDVDLVGCTIDVNKTMNAKGVIQPCPKTKASEAVVPIPEILQVDLLAWKEYQAHQMAETGMMQTDGTPVLANEIGEPLTNNTMKNWWMRKRKKLGVGDLVFHELRHTYITMLARSKVHPAVAQKLARHATNSTTMDVYTHVNQSEKRDAVELLNGTLAGTICP